MDLHSLQLPPKRRQQHRNAQPVIPQGDPKKVMAITIKTPDAGIPVFMSQALSPFTSLPLQSTPRTPASQAQNAPPDLSAEPTRILSTSTKSRDTAVTMSSGTTPAATKTSLAQTQRSLPPPGSTAKPSTPTMKSPTKPTMATLLNATKYQSMSMPESAIPSDSVSAPVSSTVLPAQLTTHLREVNRDHQKANGLNAITGVSSDLVSGQVTVNAGKHSYVFPSAKTLDYWTILSATGTIKEVPKLAGCGSWEIPLPPNMAIVSHIEPHIGRLRQLLGVHVVPRKFPPAIKVDISQSQRAKEAAFSHLIEEHTALRWKAWIILFSWIEHLERRGKAPANPPLDVVTFVRNRLMSEGRNAREQAIMKIQERQGGAVFPNSPERWQMPAVTRPTVLQNNSDAQPPGLQPTKKPPAEKALVGEKHELENSSSSDGECEKDLVDEPLKKRLRQTF